MKKLLLMTLAAVSFQMFGVPKSFAQTASVETTLTVRQQTLIPVAAFAATGEMLRLEDALNKGLDAGLSVNELKEALVQLYAYAGFPRSLNAINTLIKVRDTRLANGTQDHIGMDASPLPDGYDSNAFGNNVRNELVGRDLTHNPSAYAQFAPVIDVFLKDHLFGDIFVRDVLSYQDREIVTISILAAMEGTQAQLGSHLKVSRNVGLSIEQLDAFVNVLAEKVSADAASRARDKLSEMKG